MIALFVCDSKQKHPVSPALLQSAFLIENSPEWDSCCFSTLVVQISKKIKFVTCHFLFIQKRMVSNRQPNKL